MSLPTPSNGSIFDVVFKRAPAAPNERIQSCCEILHQQRTSSTLANFYEFLQRTVAMCWSKPSDESGGDSNNTRSKVNTSKQIGRLSKLNSTFSEE